MLFLLTLALYLLVRGTSSQRGAPWLGAGFVLGLALLTRGNALLFLPVLLAWISFVWDAPERRRLRAMAFVALGVACVLLPITLRNYAVSGDWVLLNSQAGQNFYIGNFRGNDTGAFRSPPFLHPNPQFEEQDFLREAERASGRSMRPSEVSSYWLGRGLEEIVADPAHFARHSFRKVLVLANDFEVPDNYSFDFFREYVSPALGLPLPSYGSLLPLALCGIYFARNRLATLLFAFLIAYGSSLLIFFNLSRLRLPLVPVLIVFAAYGVVVLARRVAERRWLHIGVAALFLAVSYSIVHLELTPRDLTVRFFNLGVRHASVAKEHSSRAFALRAGGDPAPVRDAFSLAEEQERQAEELFRKALANKPGSRKLRLAMRNLHVSRISNLEAQGQYARALDAALVLTREDPGFSGGFVRLARLHAKRGNEAGAIAALETALRLAPDDAIVRTQLERLRGRGTPTR